MVHGSWFMGQWMKHGEWLIMHSFHKPWPLNHSSLEVIRLEIEAFAGLFDELLALLFLFLGFLYG